jgi:hypothetical protein
VVGGRDISIDRAPWAVEIVAIFPGGQTSTCSGSIVAATRVVTAAHCLYSIAGTFVRPSHVGVFAGVSNFAIRPLPVVLQERRVSSVRVDRHFVWWADGGSASVGANDVAELTLTQPFDLSGPDVRAIRLMRASSPYPLGAEVVVAGFGGQSRRHPHSGVLAEMTASVLAGSACAPSDVLCAVSARSAVCFGDSGAGVVTAGLDPALVGVVSKSRTTCAPGRFVGPYLGRYSIRGLAAGRGRAGPAPEPAATRWVPFGWRGHTRDFSHPNWTLHLSLPRTWLEDPKPASGPDLYNPLNGEVVFIQDHLGRTYSVNESSFLSSYPAIAQRFFSEEQVRGRITTLPLSTGTGFELVFYRDGYRHQVYVLLHSSVVYTVEFEGPASIDGTNVEVFAESGHTIHFSQ